MPFPGDWLGPREELVPFGKRAYPESAELHEDDELGELALTRPPRPDAFWGEDSAEIHAVMPGPDTDERRGQLPAAAARSPSAAFRGPSNTWLRSHTVRVAAGVVVAVACAVVALARLAGSPAVDSNQARATGGGPAAAAIADGPASAAIALALLRSNAHKVGSAKPAGRASRPRPRAVVHRSRAQKPASRSTPAPGTTPTVSSAPAATSEPVASSQAAAPASSSTQSSSPTVTSVADSPTSGSTPTHPTSVRSQTASVAPGPVGPGAAFGPGHLQ